MAASLSIIIPTHKRAEILRQCLEHLERQTIKDLIEVIVVHDSEDDEETGKMIVALPYNLQPTTYFAIPKSQQGVARNRGVDRASAPIILFGQDDIFLAPNACEKHLHAHARDSRLAVLGFTTWDPDLDITPAMR